MKYKLIVLDLDDTLLKNDGTICEENKVAIRSALEKGVKVILASGRADLSIRKVAKELELEKYDGYILAYNGGKIINCKTNEVLYKAELTKEQITNLYDLANKHEVYIHTYIDDVIVGNVDNPYTYIEGEITGANVEFDENFMKRLPDTCPKVIMLQQPEHIKEVETLLKPIIKDEMTMTITKPFFLEFMNNDVDKGKSLKRLCEILQINSDEVMAIGDSYNDVTMLNFAGLAVAMGNAVEDIKNLADFVTDTNENFGVAKAINKYILN